MTPGGTWSSQSMSIQVSDMGDLIPKETVGICRKWEGYHKKLPDGRAAPYLCPSSVWTCGIGTTVWPNGQKVKPTDSPISSDYAEECLSFDLEKRYSPAVRRAVKVEMHPWMWAACYSLAYNIGTAAFAKSTLVRRINARDWAACPAAFKMWRNGGGRVLTGLLNRRIDESALFMRGVAKLGEVATVSSVSIKSTSAPIAAGPSWWQQIIQGILNGLGRPSPA